MTLCVAKKNQDGDVIVVADTREFNTATQIFFDPLTNNDLNGVFKLWIDSRILVCFAGNIKNAKNALSQIKNKKEAEIIETLKPYSLLEGDGFVDFIIAAKEESYTSLKLISNGEVEEKDNAFIGNSEAYSKFQGYFIQTKSTDLLQKRMKTSLEQVVHSREFQDVGGIVIVAVDGNSEFFFETGMHHEGFSWVKDQTSGDYRVGIGSSEQGTCTVESVHYEDEKILYYYYHQPKKLIIFKEQVGLLTCVVNQWYIAKAQAEEALSNYMGTPTKFCWG